jgi:hypothetical protein
VRVLARSLVVFMAVRVLAPPGVCLCEISLPFVGDLADLFGPDRDPADCPLDDHTHGCTTCQLPQGVQPRITTLPRPALAFELPAAAPAAPDGADRSRASASPLPAAPPRVIYLAVCSLLI